MPGDAVSARLQDGQMSPEQVQLQREALGLSKPIVEQYVIYFLNLAAGDMGISTTFNFPVSTLIAQHIRWTIELTVASLLLAVLFGPILGILCDDKRLFVAMPARLLMWTSISSPVYMSAILLVFVLSTLLDLLPATGIGSFRHLIMPTLVLVYHTSGPIARVTQSSIRLIGTQMHVVAAHGRGLKTTYVNRNYVLRIALPSTVTVIALQTGFLLSGTLVIEAVFARPGLGGLMLTAVIQRDYPLLQSLTLLSSITYAFLIIVSDLVQILLDPRITR